MHSFDVTTPREIFDYRREGNLPTCDEKTENGGCLNEDSELLSMHCPFECLDKLRNENAECGAWAAEGECKNNPLFMHYRCAESCGFALLWDPWTRRNVLNMKHSHAVDMDRVQFKCSKPEVFFQAGFIMHERLKNFIAGVSETRYEGFSYFSPSHLNMMVGATEAMVYTLRIYHLFLEKYGTPAQVSIATDTLNQLLDPKILSTYDADLLMRILPTWYHKLGEVYQLVVSVNKDPCSVISSSDGFDVLTDVFNPKVEYWSSFGLSSTRAPVISATTLLNDGHVMPTVGLGTWLIDGPDCEETVFNAVLMGYRHIDTAQAYRNERDIGRAIERLLRMGAVSREELFIASKLSSESNAGAGRTRQQVQRQLEDLKIAYFDLYMLHSPLRKDLQAETWRELEQLVDEGLIKSLGVSNFDDRELSNLVRNSRRKPVVVQNKFDVYHIGKQFDNRATDYVRVAKELNVVNVAYSSFSAYPFVMKPLDDPIVQFVATRNGLTPAETVILWSTQLGAVSIPRSTRAQGLHENLLLSLRERRSGGTAVLSDRDMALLSTIQYLVETPVTRAARE